MHTSLLCFWASTLLVVLPNVASADTPLTYNDDIRPILAENCFRCHGPDSASRKADLRLDLREIAVKTGAIQPGNGDESEIIRRILSTDPEEVMPPPATHKQIKPAQLAVLKKWIDSGAEYQSHWSLIAPTRPPIPTVKDNTWSKTPIDNFILKKLEERGLTPAPAADKTTIIRRLALDLTGLPPSPNFVAEFLADTAPNAYEKLVDKLLESKQWGEHRARYWLDVARFADSHGIHFDNYREMWAYRDWVISAFNRNLPFDQFTIEQLAGDLLPNRTLDQQIASGFNRCNITTSEGGAISEEYLVLYTRDRTETTSLVWLGLTTGCAVCHDHKFDPISQREFYSLSAFFNNTSQGAMDGNIKDTPPVLFVPSETDRPRWDSSTGELAAAKQAYEARKLAAKAEFEPWLAANSADTIRQSLPSDGLKFFSSLSEGAGTSIGFTLDGQPGKIEQATGIAWDAGHIAPQAVKTQPGGSIEFPTLGDFEKDQPFACGAWVKVPKETASGSIVARMDDQHDYRGWDLWVEGGRPGMHIVHKWPEDALKIVSKTPFKPGEWNHILVTSDGSGQPAGITMYLNGQPQPFDIPTNALKGTIKTDVPLKIGQRHTGSRIDGLGIQDLRLYNRKLESFEVDRLVKTTRASSLVAKPAEQRTPAENEELYGWWLASIDPISQECAGKITSLESEQNQIKSRGTVAHVMQERGEAAKAFILARGDYDKRKDEVLPGTPAALPAMPEELPKNRLGLAQWLLRPEHPLTSRVTVNRFWQELYGMGLVGTAGDFGVTGELPSHPELLDWMAVEFRDSGWDVKKFYKLLVMSATYQQSAVVTPDKQEKDGQNRLLSRGPRFRMDAEMVRDYALACSGLLVPKIGGPSVKPYQPAGVWEAVAMIGSNTRDYVPDKGEGLYRRSMYTFWKRSAPPASMDILNAPNRETCAVRRERNNTALQALVTLNDPQLIEAARNLSQQAIQAGGDSVEGRISFLAQRVICRPLQAAELSIVRGSLEQLFEFYAEHETEAKALIAVGDSVADPSVNVKQLAAFTMLTNELLNLDEVLNK